MAICRGKDNGRECDCEAYYPPEYGGRPQCQECLHGPSKHSPASDQQATSLYCRGITDNGISCDCEAYFTPEPGSRPACQECLHGISKHPSYKPGPETKLKLPVGAASSKTVMSIFNHTTKGQNDVREEMLKGYRPPMAAVKAKVSK
jgi:hypothetical protein